MTRIINLREKKMVIHGIILLDGADGAGKTTLAEKIKERAEKLGADAVVHHLGKPARGRCWQEHSDALTLYIKEAFLENKLVIADRHFLSEAIYGTVYRDGSEYPYAARHFDRLMHRFRCLRVICAPPVEHVVETHARLKGERHEEYDDKMDEVAHRYLDLWNGAVFNEDDKKINYYYSDDDYISQLTYRGGVNDKIGWYHYDVTEHGKDMDLYARFLLHELETEQNLIDGHLLDPETWCFTGYPQLASALLVGDRLSAPNPLGVPFYANHACSEYLAKTLQHVVVDESRLVIANINDESGARTVAALQERCGRTIVMGREAEREMLRLGMTFDARIRHPQHPRRFNYKDKTYAKELIAALAGYGLMGEQHA